jgi:hypothetical protein
MRFSTALTLPQPLIAPAIDALVRRVTGEAAQPQAEPVQAPPRELPEDLDQRVRLLGEW